MKDEIKYCSRQEGIIGYGDSKIAKDETNDCVVATIASCFDITYDRAHSFCKDYFNRYNRQGTLAVPFKMNSFYILGKHLNHKKVKPMGKKTATIDSVVAKTASPISWVPISAAS